MGWAKPNRYENTYFALQAAAWNLERAAKNEGVTVQQMRQRAISAFNKGGQPIPECCRRTPVQSRRYWKRDKSEQFVNAIALD